MDKAVVKQHAHHLQLALNIEYNSRVVSMTTMQHALQNGVVIIQPPPQQADQMMLHYAHAKAADDSIAALILLPSDHCTHVTDHLVHIDTYPPESHHWRTPPEVPYSLWYDPQGHN